MMYRATHSSSANSQNLPIRVMVVDDHAVVRSGLAAFLLAYDDLELVGEAASGAEALAMAERCRPDVVLMDLVMPEMDGATATRRLRERHPEIQVIVLTSFKEEDMVQGALAAGAIGYLLKNASADELVNAIRAARMGRPTLAPEATQVLIHSATHPKHLPLGHDLTERERDVLALMVTGLNNNEIAEKLVVSRSTVKYHVSNILSKLQAASRTEAVAYALQQKLVDFPADRESSGNL
ncbi:MAG: response regulator transcription factor [Caldilinea sp.]|nr:response regulator transcription factor [Caldilinea sp.]MDW8442697.1 response regulator transcription factor [Caldilineaceae bacterium]